MKRNRLAGMIVAGCLVVMGGSVVRAGGWGDFFNSVSSSSESSSYQDRVIEGVFRDEFDRMPSAREYTRYRELMREKGWTEADIRDDLRSQDEARFQGHRREGRRSDDDFRDRRNRSESGNPDMIIRRAYQDILGREPDTTGMRVYRSHMLDDGWSEQDVRSDLRKSPEREGKTPESAEAIIRRAYQDILGRQPDASGMATYKSKLLYEGWQERDVRSDLKKSSERRETGGISQEQAQQVVRQAYQSVLGRDADASGLALYTDKIRREHWSQSDVANALRNSPEYKQKRGRK